MIRFCRSLARSMISPFSADAVIHRQLKLKDLPDRLLVDHADGLRERRLDGEPESALAVETFALLREAAQRRLGIQHRDNQLDAAWHLLHRRIVELPTGEGKTLAATPAIALRALTGRGVWLATANDYLARRDALTMQAVFELLGLTTGYLQSDHTLEDRRRAYACDITYGTIREFGFDFLRDRLSGCNKVYSIDEKRLQRDRFSLIVDEADSILLDDARTPLIISEPKAIESAALIFRWSSAVSVQLRENTDFLSDPTSTRIWLTEIGRSAIRASARPEIVSRVSLPEAYEFVSRSIEAQRTFQLNRDYVVRDGKLVIVDRLNGRLAWGRQWQHGVQQTLEAANQLEITPETKPVAKVTIQTFVRGFEHLSGMTGTALESQKEFGNTYSLQTRVIRPFRPCLRTEQPCQIHNNRKEKWSSVVAAVEQVRKQKRPVLIGTRDLIASEELSRFLQSANIEHQVLTARQEASEADLISRAGIENTVTVSTSIAGRGTDIQLGRGVAERGGLHVIAADLFDASRIDRQLAGRGGRQGDPATYQKILSLEDDLLETAWDRESCQRRMQRVRKGDDSQKMHFFRHAQRLIEQRHREARRNLLNHDRERAKRHQQMGFNPYLDDVDS